MLKDEWSLFVCMTLEASGISACRKTRLLQLKAAVWIVTIAALHHPFQHLVMKRPAELGFSFSVTTDAELRLASAQHIRRQQITISSCSFGQEFVRTRIASLRYSGVRRMTIRAPYVVAPMLAAAEVVVFLFAGMTAQTGL